MLFKKNCIFTREFKIIVNDGAVKQIPYGVADFQSVIERDLNGYAVAPRVEALRQGTQMHKVIMQFYGWELVRMEEV